MTMKIYISVDMEGIWGITHPDQVSHGTAEYQRGRQLMTEEVNLVVQELFEQGVKEIVVNDAHGLMNNILIESLNENVRLISGNEKPFGMMQGLDEHFDGVILLGYHPRAITEKGLFDHTFSGRLIRNVNINGKDLGEAGINALLAMHYKVPVIMVTGDDVVSKQVQEEIGPVQTVVTKTTISRFCAEHIAKTSLQKSYKDTIQKALSNIKNYPKKTPMPTSYVCRLTFKDARHIEGPLLLPIVKKINDDMIEIRNDDFPTLYKTLRAMIGLAA